MKKSFLMLIILLILTGCTVVRIDTSSIDNITKVVLSKNNTLYNRVGRGYKYYVPRGVTYIDSSGLNDKLYSGGVYYYLYLDEISYYYRKSVDFKKDSSKYYSEKIKVNKKVGYLEITEVNGLYLIEFVYNYAKIETLVPKKDIKKSVLNSSYILSTIKYNPNTVKLSLNEDFLKNKEETYQKYTQKIKDENSFLKHEEK